MEGRSASLDALTGWVRRGIDLGGGSWGWESRMVIASFAVLCRLGVGSKIVINVVAYRSVLSLPECAPIFPCDLSAFSKV